MPAVRLPTSNDKAPFELCRTCAFVCTHVVIETRLMSNFPHPRTPFYGRRHMDEAKYADTEGTLNNREWHAFSRDLNRHVHIPPPSRLQDPDFPYLPRGESTDTPAPPPEDSTATRASSGGAMRCRW